MRATSGLALLVLLSGCMADVREQRTPSWRAGDCVVADDAAVGVVGPDGLIYAYPQDDPVVMQGPPIGSVETDAMLDAGVLGPDAVVLPLAESRSVCP